MATITTRDGLKEYCLRRLGFPVIEINVDDDQVEDRVQDAIEHWQEYHFDGVERIWLKAQVLASTLEIQTAAAPQFVPGAIITGATSGATAEFYNATSDTTLVLKKVVGTFVNNEVITQPGGATATTTTSNAFFQGNWDTQYFDISENVTGVIRVLSIGPSNLGSVPRNIFDVVYQFRLTDMYDLMSSDMIYYTQVKTHLEMLDMILQGQRTIRFNRKMNRLYVECNWAETFLPGDYVVAECYRLLDPEIWTEVYNDLFLKRYATALIKRQWGENMKKFGGIQLPGGVVLNGQIIYDEAMQEIATIEQEMQLRYELPVDFMIG
jgi:hypothetical protein